MLKRLENFLTRVQKPLLTIEYIVYLICIAYAIIVILSIGSAANDVGDQPPLIERYSIVPILFFIMAHLAITGIIGIGNRAHHWALVMRRVSLLLLTVGFAFIEPLVIFNFGWGSIRWINNLALTAITTILYLNLKVNGPYASE